MSENLEPVETVPSFTWVRLIVASTVIAILHFQFFAALIMSFGSPTAKVYHEEIHTLILKIYLALPFFGLGSAAITKFIGRDSWTRKIVAYTAIEVVLSLVLVAAVLHGVFGG